MAKTFAQYLIDDVLPGDIQITQQVDKKYLNALLTRIAREYPDKYGQCVMDLKRLADKFSTYEPITMGLDEISVPDKAKRDSIIKKYKPLIEDKKQSQEELAHTMQSFIDELSECNINDKTHDDATTMINAAMGGKKIQLMKLRTSPGLVADHKNKPFNIVFNKSYAEGVDPVHFWIGATDARRNIATGQVRTSEPGELGKLINNIVADTVVSVEDCGTKAGILLGVRDEDIIGRYLARDEAGIKANTLIDQDIQQKLLKSGLDKILVRSPQTCHAQGSSICQKCLGLRNSTNKPYEIGENAGLISGGIMLEPLQQMVLSAKHSAINVKTEDKLERTDGLRQLVFAPKIYRNKKILCELIGEVYKILPAPQGGTVITIHQTKLVPERYIEEATPVKNQKMFWEYYVPPNMKVLVKRGDEVYPGMALTNGFDNLKDIARLHNLGYLRSVASQGMYDIYKNTGVKLDRRHFELLSRSAHRYVQVVKCPKNAFFVQGENVAYTKLVDAVKTMPKHQVNVQSALGKVLAEPVLDMLIGTEIDSETQRYLTQNNVYTVYVVDGLEITSNMVPFDRVVSQQEDWLAALNHRFLKDQIIDAANTGKKTDIHGFNPISAYAYGTEFGTGSSKVTY